MFVSLKIYVILGFEQKSKGGHKITSMQMGNSYYTDEVYTKLHSIYIQFISYSKCSNWCQISKLLSNFGCLFTFCYLDGANSIKTDLHIFNL